MKIRTLFVSNSSSASFLLGIKGNNIRDAVTSFFKRHEEVFNPVIQELRDFDFNGQPEEYLDVKTIADLIKHSSVPFKPTKDEINLRLGITAQYPEYKHIVKEDAKRQIAKGLTLYWTRFMEDVLPGRFVYFVFNEVMDKDHEDDEFCFLLMPAERC